MSAVGALLRKDLRAELRTGETVPAMCLFAITTFVIFHFAPVSYTHLTLPTTPYV